MALRIPSVRSALRFTVACSRAAFFCALVFVACSLVATRMVYGQVGEKVMSFGRDLAPFADLLYGTHRVTLNGEAIYLASALSEQSKGVLLDRFEEGCRQHSGGLVEQFDSLPSAKKSEIERKAPVLWGLRYGMMRREDATEGMVMCFDQRDPQKGGPSGIRAVAARLKEFARTGELSALGNLRYAYVRAMPTGKSQVITTFTEGPFNVYRVIGREGEPPGVDPPAPRMPGMRRMLSVSADGMPYGVQSYQTSASTPDDVVAFYEGELPKLGWKRMMSDEKVYRTAIYERGGMVMSVGAIQLVTGADTVITFTEGSSVNPRPDFVAQVQ